MAVKAASASGSLGHRWGPLLHGALGSSPSCHPTCSRQKSRASLPPPPPRKAVAPPPLSPRLVNGTPVFCWPGLKPRRHLESSLAPPLHGHSRSEARLTPGSFMSPPPPTWFQPPRGAYKTASPYTLDPCLPLLHTEARVTFVRHKQSDLSRTCKVPLTAPPPHSLNPAHPSALVGGHVPGFSTLQPPRPPPCPSHTPRAFSPQLKPLRWHLLCAQN